ncbi:MAG: hypothetical protein VZQ61_07050 [Christensenellaceae bacterium]
MDRILFKGKASALTAELKEISVRYKGLTVVNYLNDLARERKAKTALAGNTKEQTSRAATL